MLLNAKTKQRTLYHGEKKFFVPKKSAITNPDAFIEDMTASSLREESSTFIQELAKKTEGTSIRDKI